MKTIVKDLVVRDRHFVIAKNKDGYYLAIEDKYIDENGKLNARLNGFDMHASKELSMCIATTRNCVEMEYLFSKGYTRDEAFNIVLHNMLEEMEG